MNQYQKLAEDYVALWNEKDILSRRRAIATIWRCDAVHFAGARTARGLDQLEARISASHEKNVRDCGYVFRVAGDVLVLHDAVTFHWEMIPAHGGPVAARGLEFLLTDTDHQIAADYQFIVG